MCVFVFKSYHNKVTQAGTGAGGLYNRNVFALEAGCPDQSVGRAQDPVVLFFTNGYLLAVSSEDLHSLECP